MTFQVLRERRPGLGDAGVVSADRRPRDCPGGAYRLYNFGRHLFKAEKNEASHPCSLIHFNFTSLKMAMAFIHDLPPEILQEIARWVLINEQARIEPEISCLPEIFEDEAHEQSLAALQRHSLRKALFRSFIEGLETVHSCYSGDLISTTITTSFTARYVIIRSVELIHWL